MKKLIILILVIGSLSALYFFVIKPRLSQPAPNIAMSKVEVTVMKVQKQQVQPTLDLPGRVNSFRIAEVRPQVDGVIKKIKFNEGSLVNEGDSLYQIDPSIYQAAYDGAWYNLIAARAKKNRYQNLLKEDAVSKQEFDDAVATYALADADFRKARTNLDFSKVLAPISGFVGKSNVTEGALASVTASPILTTITQLDPIYVDVVQPSKDALKMSEQIGIEVGLINDELNYSERGELKLVEVFADESTDSVRLRAIFKNAERKLIPGMFVNARLFLKPFEAITVPQKAASRAPDGSLLVWVVTPENTAKMRPIKASQIFGDSWIVSEGLQEGEVVIVAGFLKIAEGAVVNPVFEDKPK